MEVYIDDMLVKSIDFNDHIVDLAKTFGTLRRHNIKLNLVKYSFGISAGKFLRFMVSQCGIEFNPEKIKALLYMHPTR